MTAWFNLLELANLSAGDQVLIHAGASSVGISAIQLAALRGAKVFATVGSDQKADFCRGFGATQAINYKTHDFATEIEAVGGVDVILDCIGGSYLGRNIACLKADGRMIVIGTMGGVTGELDLRRLLVKRLRVQGSTLRPQPLSVKAKLTDALRSDVLPALQSGRIRLTLDCVFDWESVAEAHTYIESSQNRGKVVLRVI
jgi:NADPH2:quinone reductase